MIPDLKVFYIAVVLPIYLCFGSVFNRSYNYHSHHLTGLEGYGFYDGWNWFFFFIAPIFGLAVLAILFSFVVWTWLSIYETKWIWMEAISLNIENQDSKKTKIFFRVVAGFSYLCFGFLINLLYLMYFKANSVPANAHVFQIYSGLYTIENLLIIIGVPLMFFLILCLLYRGYTSLKTVIKARSNAKIEEREFSSLWSVREVTEEEILARHDKRKMALFDLISKKKDADLLNDYQLNVSNLQNIFKDYTELCSTIAHHSIEASQNVYHYLIYTLCPTADQETIKSTSMVVKILGGGRRPVSLKELESLVHSVDSQKQVMDFLNTLKESEVWSNGNEA